MTLNPSQRPGLPQTGPDHTAVPLSPAQQSVWLLGQWSPDGPPLSHVLLAARLTGELDPGALESALHTVVERHPALATRFTVVDGRPVQTSGTGHGLTLTRHDLRELDAAARARRLDLLTEQTLREPFDLGNGPLVRGLLIRCAEHEHRVVLACHRLAVDPASAALLLREALSLHSAADSPDDTVVRAPVPLLEPLPADAGSDGPPPQWPGVPSSGPAELPLDRPRPAERDLTVDAVPLVVPAATAAGLRRLAEECGGSLATATLAVYVLLLHRYGQSAPVVNVTTAGRAAPDITAVGCFEQLVPVSFEVAGEPSFRQLVRAVRRRVAGAVLGATRARPAAEPSTGPAPLWPSFSHRNAPRLSGPPGLICEFLPVRPRWITGDLALHLTEGDDGLSGHLLFARDVFDEDTARRAVAHYLRLADGAVTDPDRPVHTLPLLTAGEEETIRALNGVTIPVPDLTFPQVFEARAADTPAATAVRAEDTCLDYGELNRRANQLCSLLDEHGVGPEVTVGLCLERSAQLAVAVLGVLKAGGTYVPLDPNDPPSRRDSILDDAGVRVVVTHAGGLPPGSGGGRRVIELDSEWTVLENRPARNPPAGRHSPSHAAYLLYTSGSTGRPKGVVIEHRQLMNYVCAVTERFGIQEPLSFAMVQPLTVDSSVTSFVLPLYTGGEVHMITRERALDAGKLADWAQRRPFDCLKIAPSHLRALQASPRFTELLPRRLLVIGGEASAWGWLQELQRLVPHCRVFNHYGPTETTVGVLTLAVADHPNARWTTAPIGVPLPNTQAHVVDGTGSPVPFGVAGELLVGGGNVGRGYHRADDLTRASFLPDALGGAPGSRLYRTGDIVRRLPDGIVEFLGRRDDQIKIRGFRVALGEIDAALTSCPSVRHAVTVVREDLPGDRRIVSYVEPEDGRELSMEAVERHIRERLSPHMMPQALVPLPELPLSEHGKVNRRKLPPPPAGPAPSAPVPPRNELERSVAEAWKGIFQVDEVSAEQNFFDIGGHSLLLVELQHRLRQTTGRDIGLLDLFQHTTVRAQAEFFARQREPSAASSVSREGAQRNALLKRRQQQLRAKRGQHD
ncbi:amino acid adenylation domain-containing protein [Streptomyces sp. S.PNR 29]|uniref:non-ribosomal peptide synthetase n=1 Tax=Streptomyces sp. S.PNR 29 TaxID=2973805 RepID=UPI0025AFF797|nr:amino acid adenylation domain-containing protein [Streptomyces sp. S.PNR 29]MDN0197607.1 amino acid adenylation domain-containing protein [Streptomyces sp. S.PNR 29]